MEDTLTVKSQKRATHKISDTLCENNNYAGGLCPRTYPLFNCTNPKLCRHDQTLWLGTERPNGMPPNSSRNWGFA